MHDDNELPMDYEPCGDCGFDHAYEPEKAQEAHSKGKGRFFLDKNRLFQMASRIEDPGPGESIAAGKPVKR